MRTKIIAEIGINHNGSVELAKKMIDLACIAGCDYVKFQKRNPEVCVPKDQRDLIRDTPWGKMTYIDYKHKIEFGENEYSEIDSYCKEKYIKWSASVWDTDSLNFISNFDVDFIKIPSALVLDDKLISESFATGKQVILSTGMCTTDEANGVISSVVYHENKYKKLNADKYRPKPVIMHTNSTYPCKVDDLNLSYIKYLNDKSRAHNNVFSVGYSGHEFGSVTTIAAVCFGATYIERHITLDRAMWGTDQLSSLGPKGLFELVSGIREVERSYSDFSDYGHRALSEEENKIRIKLRGY